MLVEALILVLLAIVAAIGLLSAALTLSSDWLASQYGLFLSANLLTIETLKVVSVITLAAIVTSAIPAFEAYKNALHSSLSSK